MCFSALCLKKELKWLTFPLTVYVNFFLDLWSYDVWIHKEYGIIQSLSNRVGYNCTKKGHFHYAIMDPATRQYWSNIKKFCSSNIGLILFSQVGIKKKVIYLASIKLKKSVPLWLLSFEPPSVKELFLESSLSSSEEFSENIKYLHVFSLIYFRKIIEFINTHTLKTPIVKNLLSNCNTCFYLFMMFSLF